MIVHSFFYIGEIAATFISRPNAHLQMNIGVVLALTTPAVAAGALWWLAPYFATFAANGMAETIPSENITAISLTSVAFVVTGVVLLTFNLPSLIVSIFQYLNEPQGRSLAWAFSLTAECGLGLCLILGSNKLAEFVSKFRYAGSGR